MSRGHGRVQRQILDLLAIDDESVCSLENLIFEFGIWPTRAQTESIRRALKRLCDEGAVIRYVKHYPGHPLAGGEGDEITYRLSVGAPDTNSQHLAATPDEADRWAKLETVLAELERERQAS